MPSSHKRCSTCREAKPLDQFHLRRSSKDGLGYICKLCGIEKSKAWRVENAGRHRAASSLWQKQNKDRANERSRSWRARNKTRRREICKGWERRNTDYLRMKLAERRAKIVMPGWADKKKIAAFYRLATKLEKETGVRHHVYHIVPVNSPLVCGLHVETNLQVIQATENLAKSNREWPDMPEALLRGAKGSDVVAQRSGV